MFRRMIVVILGSHNSGTFWWCNLLSSVETEIQVRFCIFTLHGFSTVSEFAADYKALTKGRAILVLVSLDDWLGYIKTVSFLICKNSAKTFFRLMFSFLFRR